MNIDEFGYRKPYPFELESQRCDDGCGSHSLACDICGRPVRPYGIACCEGSWCYRCNPFGRPPIALPLRSMDARKPYGQDIMLRIMGARPASNRGYYVKRRRKVNPGSVRIAYVTTRRRKAEGET